MRSRTRSASARSSGTARAMTLSAISSDAVKPVSSHAAELTYAGRPVRSTTTTATAAASSAAPRTFSDCGGKDIVAISATVPPSRQVGPPRASIYPPHPPVVCRPVAAQTGAATGGGGGRTGGRRDRSATGSLGDQAVADADGDGVGALVDAELGEDRLAVRADGGLGDPEPLGDLG